MNLQSGISLAEEFVVCLFCVIVLSCIQTTFAITYEVGTKGPLYRIADVLWHTHPFRRECPFLLRVNTAISLKLQAECGI